MANELDRRSRAEEPERNPMLGLRSIRFCLQNIGMFRTQLRAILRASAYGPIKIMFPLISTAMELRQTKMILGDVMEELQEEGIAFDPDIAVGIMIEVPSAALMASVFAREVSFFSIGTNDLIQYTLAVDRDNRKVASMYEPLHPAVLQSIKMVCDAARDAGRPVSMCGEMAGNPAYTLFLLGIGLDELSMGPLYVPVIKKLVRSVKISDAERIAADLLRYDTVEEVKGYMFHCLREFGLIELVEAFN